MTNNQLTRERLEKIKSWRDTYGAGSNVMLPAEEAEELACLALAAMDSEPVAVPDHLTYLQNPTLENVLSDAEENSPMAHAARILAREVKFWRSAPLYRHAQPAPEKYNIGDATMRHIFTPTGMTNVSDMQAVFDRIEAVLVGMEQPAPVVDADDNFYSWFGREWQDNYQHNQYTTAAKQMLGVMAESAWKAGRRAAMLQDQSDDDGEPTDDERIMAIEGIHNCERCSDEGWIVGEMGITRCACGQAGNSPVIPDGYVMVPKEPTERMVIDGFESEPDETFSEPEVWEAFQKMSGCEQAAFRARLCWAAMLAAAPQEVKGE